MGLAKKEFQFNSCYSANTYPINKRIKFVQYTAEKILKALLLAPLPLLFFTALLFIIMNREYSLYSIVMVIAVHAFIYLAYCILTVPFSFVISVILNRYSLLSLLTVGISSLIIATPFFIVFGWSHTGEFSKQWWKIYADIPTILLVLFPGLCYWLILKK